MGKKKKRAEVETESEAETKKNESENNQTETETNLSLNGDSPKKKKKKKKAKAEEKTNSEAKADELPTVSIAIAGSIIDNAQSLELATRLASQIARAATIFRIDEVVVFDNKRNSANNGALRQNNSNEDERGAAFLVRILQYLETPQYLRKALFPKHNSLRYVGMLPPLDAPHHLRKHEWAPYREGVTLKENATSSGGTLVDVGLDKNVVVNEALEPGIRVTVAMGTDNNLNSDLPRQVVSSSKPREAAGTYWGYKVRYASNISSVFKESPYKGGYDHLIGTSEHGLIVSSSQLNLPAFRHLLIAFGGLSGLEKSVEEDHTLKGKNVRNIFDMYLNTCPHQGSRTIRTEEAILISLQYFQEPVTRALERALEHQQQKEEPCLDNLQKAKSLICALNFVSRNLPLPPDLFDVVSSICHDEQEGLGEATDDGTPGEDGSDGAGVSQIVSDDSTNSKKDDLLGDLDDALSRQRSKFMSGFGLAESKENRYQSHLHHRLNELEELPPSRGKDLQAKCLLELYGIKLAELQSKIRSQVSSEYWLQLNCAYPDKQLFDWGMARLPFTSYGIFVPYTTEADDQARKKRDYERLSRLREEEKNNLENRKKKFFSEIVNAFRDFQLQIQATLKRRKQRNDGVQAWHGRQRQRATRAEKLRFQALKSDDQEAYMRLVKESKNERLTMLLSETNKLLVNLGAAVQRQKDAKNQDGIEDLKDLDSDSPEIDALKDGTPQDSPPEEELETTDSDQNDDSSDLLEGQRQYNSAIHAIQEKVTEQPSLLQGGELRPYQLEGLQWMLSLFNNNLNGILADEMGLGKTIQTISLIAYLLENKGVTGPHLIVAPKAVLPNWINEFSTWAPSIHAVLYDGRIDERKALREEISRDANFSVLITHYDLIMRDKTFLKKIHWFYMIVDEGHRLKNHDCALARTLLSGYQIQRRLLLTGTPIQNSLQELWSLLNFLLPNIFNSVQNFEEWFNAPFADRGDVSLTDEEELLIIRRLHHVIRPFILRRKKDEVEKYLPGKSQVILKCDLSAWQKAYYQQVTEKGRVGLDNGSGKSKSLQNLTMQLRKCCNHPYLFVPHYNMWQREEIVRASGKFELLDRLLPKLHRTGHRVLLFSQMTHLMDILEIYLRLNDFMYLRLDGSTKTEERGTLLKKFNAPDSPYFMFLLSTRAGGLGLNLQTADTVIIFDSDWNPQMDQQAEDRAHRIGQKKEVRVFVLVSVGSIEEVILERAKQKMGIDAKVIQAGLFNTTSTAQDRKEMLEEIMRRGTRALGTDVPSEREINRLAARSDEEFRMFEQMDEARRLKENYRSRLMEEHEVPEWVYEINNDEAKAKSLENNNVELGKRKRKGGNYYSDTLSDLQFMRAVENAEDMAKKVSSSSKRKRKDHLPSEGNESVTVSNNIEEEKKVSEFKNENVLAISEGTSEDTYGSAPKRLKSNGEITEEAKYPGVEKSEHKGVGGGSWNDRIVTWNTYKKKRSSYVFPSSSSDSKQNSSGRGNGWA
ncbi:SNF2-related protein [Corchorus capsularis]|uniref:DNA helicase n=1 Tax=Corchorus capsularis TaxID=210143 RepID=A0A1R3GT60_COCAP|nr:SNF2-related protein [Corchorus capsularis]